MVLAIALAAPIRAARGQVIALRPRPERLNLDSLEARAARESLDAVAHYQVALGYLQRERFDRADSALRRALSLDPRYADAHLALAVAQDGNRRYWNQLQRRGDSAVAAERLARASLMRRAFLLDPLVDIRVLAYADQRRGAAHPALREMARQAQLGYGWLYLSLDRAMARELEHHGGLRDSVPPGLLWFHALAGARANQLPAAIQDMAALVRLSAAAQHGDSLQAFPLLTNEFRYILAALNQRAGRRTTAFALYREVLEQDVGNFMAYVQLARIHEEGEEWSQALQARRQAVAVNPEDPSLVRDLGMTLSKMQRYAEAESALVRARDLNPLDPVTHYELGLARLFLGNQSDGRASLATFLELAPSRLTAMIADARQLLARP
jgi:Tfp pilus assembly protein PilF